MFYSIAEVPMEDMGAKMFDGCMDACDTAHVMTQNEYGDVLTWKTSEAEFDTCEMACATAAGYSDFYEDGDAPEGAPTSDDDDEDEAPVLSGGAPSPTGGPVPNTFTDVTDTTGPFDFNSPGSPTGAPVLTGGAPVLTGGP